jgi:hypothetical protein
VVTGRGLQNGWQRRPKSRRRGTTSPAVMAVTRSGCRSRSTVPLSQLLIFASDAVDRAKLDELLALANAHRS